MITTIIFIREVIHGKKEKQKTRKNNEKTFCDYIRSNCNTDCDFGGYCTHESAQARNGRRKARRVSGFDYAYAYAHAFSYACSNAYAHAFPYAGAYPDAPFRDCKDVHFEPR